MRQATFFKQLKTLTYFRTYNTSETVNCPNVKYARDLIAASGVSQELIKL